MKNKISHLEARRLAACRAELSLSKKISEALAARNIDFPRLDRLQVKYRAAIDRIAAAETELHRHRVERGTHELAEFLRSLFTPSLTPAS